MRVAVLLLVICSSSAYAADGRSLARETATVSLTVPIVASVELRATTSGVDVSVFDTASGVMVLRCGGADDARRELLPVSLRPISSANAAAVGTGRWTTIHDRDTVGAGRVSLRGEAAGSVSYEIWHF